MAARSGRRSLWLTLVALAVVGSVFYADTLPLEENPFSLVFHLGNETYGPEREAAALREVDELDNLLATLFHGLTFEEKTQPQIDQLRSRLQSFDIAGFYEMMPELNGDRHAVIRGGLVDQGYLIAMEEVAETLPWTERRRVGDLQIGLDVSAPSDPDLPEYGIEGRTAVHMGGIASDELSYLLEEFLQRVGTPYSYDGVSDSMEEIRRRFLNLRREDTRLMHMIRYGMPNLYGRIERYFEIHDVLNHVTQEGQPAALINLDFSFLLQNIAEDYPELGAYLADLTVLGSLDATLKDLDGNRLARMQFDSQEMRGNAQCVLRDGALVPCDEGWNAVGKEPLRFTSLRSFTGYWEVDALVNFSGLVFDIQDIRLYARYRRRRGRISVETSFTEKPDITEVSGAAYGIFPSWLIDVVIPGNLQEMMDGFIGAAARGKDGDGTIVEVALAPEDRSSGTHGLDVHIATAILHSGFLATVSDIFGDLVVPTDEERASLWTFGRDAYDAFSADYRGFREQYPE